MTGKAYQALLNEREPVYVERHARGIINTGTSDASAAVQRAIDYCYNKGNFGGRVIAPGGILRFDSQVILPTGIVLEGQGEGVTTYRRNNAAWGDHVSILKLNGVAAGLEHATVDGNAVYGVANAVNDRVTGYYGSEVLMTANDCYLEHITIKNVNCWGVNASADHPRGEWLTLIGQNRPLASYLPTIGPVFPNTGYPSRDFGGLYAWFSGAGVAVVSNTTLKHVRCHYWRSAPLALAGTGIHLDDILLFEGHRQYLDYQTHLVATGAPLTGATSPTAEEGKVGGGQIAFFYSWNGSGGPTPNLATTNVRLDGCEIQITSGDKASGLDVNGGSDMVFDNFRVETISGWGASIISATDVQLNNGHFRSVSNGIGTAAVRVYNMTRMGISSCMFLNQKVGIQAIAGPGVNSTSHLTIENNIFEGSAGGNNIDLSGAASLATNLGGLTTRGNHFVDGTAFAERISKGNLFVEQGQFGVTLNLATNFALFVNNNHANGYGLQLAAGSTGSHFVFRWLRADQTQLGYILSNGQTKIGALGTGYALILDTNQAAGLNPLLTFERGAADKGYIGLNPSDQVSMIDGTGNVMMFMDSSNAANLKMGGVALDWKTWPVGGPNIYQGGYAAIGVNYCRYIQIGKMILVKAKINVINQGGAIAGNPILLADLPAALVPTDAGIVDCVGGFTYYNVTTGYHIGSLLYTGGNNLNMIGDASTTNGIGASPNFNVNTNDQVSFYGMWQVA